MTTHAANPDAQATGFQGLIPPVDTLLAEVIATLTLAAHAYLEETESGKPDLTSAEVAIDVATAAFERVKERLRPEQRTQISQMLTNIRMTFVQKRGS
jgi:hypothetical protein